MPATTSPDARWRNTASNSAFPWRVAKNSADVGQVDFRVFHPLVMPLATLVMVFALILPVGLPEVFMYMGVVVLVNTLAPAVSIWVLHRRGYLSDWTSGIEKSARCRSSLARLLHHDVCAACAESSAVHPIGVPRYVDGAHGPIGLLLITRGSRSACTCSPKVGCLAPSWRSRRCSWCPRGR